MKLGPIELQNDLILAPLMDVTTPSFRNLVCNCGGVGMVITPMIFVQQVVMAPKTILPHMEHISDQRPSAIQLVASGKNKDHIIKALDILSCYEFDMIDINAGCPAPHTMRSGGGGGYLREYHSTKKLDRLENVVRTCQKYSSMPVSVKTRLGFEQETDILDISKQIESWGITYLTLHGRTVKQKYQGEVNLDVIRKVKDQLSIPVVGNGDVKNYLTYKAMKEQTGVDGVMIGRAAMADPFVFAKIEVGKAAEKSKQPLPLHKEHMTLKQIRKLLEDNDNFIHKSSKFWNTERFRSAEMRRLAIWFIKGIPGYRRVREHVSKIHDLNILKNYIFGAEIERDFIMGMER